MKYYDYLKVNFEKCPVLNTLLFSFINYFLSYFLSHKHKNRKRGHIRKVWSCVNFRLTKLETTLTNHITYSKFLIVFIQRCYWLVLKNLSFIELLNDRIFLYRTHSFSYKKRKENFLCLGLIIISIQLIKDNEKMSMLIRKSYKGNMGFLFRRIFIVLILDQHWLNKSKLIKYGFCKFRK